MKKEGKRDECVRNDMAKLITKRKVKFWNQKNNKYKI